MIANPLLHPATIAMIETGGMTVEDYVRMTAPVLLYKTRPDIGAPSTRILGMPGLPAHTGGYTGQDEVMVSVWLNEDIRFISGAPRDGASVLMDERRLPETILGAIEGRRIDEVVDHPMLRIPGLTVVETRRMSVPYAGAVKLILANVRWRQMPVGVEIGLR